MTIITEGSTNFHGFHFSHRRVIDSNRNYARFITEPLLHAISNILIQQGKPELKIHTIHKNHKLSPTTLINTIRNDIMQDPLPPSIDGQLVSLHDLENFHYASDFSGMDCGSYSIKNMITHATKLTHHWLCDNNPKVLKFLKRNYPDIHNSKKIFSDVRRRPVGIWHKHIDFYLAGPPCQGFSSAGGQNMWSDFRSRLYFQSIATIITCLPEIAMIENSVNIDTNGGVIVARITLLLANAGYHISNVRINTQPWSTTEQVQALHSMHKKRHDETPIHYSRTHRID
jgi:hypothetical protein